MEKQNKLTSEILDITDQIRNRFPSWYLLLNETPLFPTTEPSKISQNDLEQYLESITAQWRHFSKID